MHFNSTLILKYPYKVNSILSPNWGIFLPFQFSVIFTPLSLFLKSGICLESFLKECRKHSSLLASRAWRFDRIRIWKTFWFLFVNKTFLNYFNALTYFINLQFYITKFTAFSTLGEDSIIRALVLIRSRKPLINNAVVVWWMHIFAKFFFE